MLQGFDESRLDSSRRQWDGRILTDAVGRLRLFCGFSTQTSTNWYKKIQRRFVPGCTRIDSVPRTIWPLVSDCNNLAEFTTSTFKSCASASFATPAHLLSI